MSKSELFRELNAIVETWNPFDLVPKSQQDACRKIGQQLFDIGGISLMQDAYYWVKEKNRCASVLQSYWDGIGEWRW